MKVIENTQPINRTNFNHKQRALFEDIQANILKGHSRDFVKLLFLKFDSERIEDTKAWIRDLAVNKKINSFNDQLAQINLKNKNVQHFKDNDPGIINVSLSASGIEALGLALPDDVSFRRGMNLEHDPVADTWEVAYQKPIDAVITIANSNEGLFNNSIATFKNALPASTQLVTEEDGKVIRQGGTEVEHFGFADGISQPRFFEEDILKRATGTNRWNSFAPLELALAHDPNGTTFSGSKDNISVDGETAHSYGSFLAFRKLEQNVKKWNEEVIKVAGQLGEPADLIGAYAVGRFKDGTPVVKSKQSNGNIDNDFNFSNDKGGSKCPFHSHIRKTNPREETGREDEKEVRIVRRGITYGERAEGFTDAPSKDVGLLFMCYQSDLNKQFEEMQNTWADSPTFLRNKPGIDSVIGQSKKNSINKKWPESYGDENNEPLDFTQTVTLKGGAYFFTPSISSLKNLKFSLS